MEQLLDKHGYFVGPPHGYSMYPTLRDHKDTMHIVKKSGELKKYDVVLFRRSNGQLVVHRLLKIKNGQLTICGDGQFKKEYSVKENQVLGVMDSFFRGEKEIKCTSKLYRAYVKIWCFSLPTKRVLKFFYELGLRIGRFFR